jgi:micrococcal nuclease
MHRLLKNRQLRTLIALLLIVAAAYIADVPFPIPQGEPQLNGFHRVMQVYDGDTIAILKDGERVTVRLIGIDTPEVDTPYTKAECYGSEASKAARELLLDQMVRIETDPTQDMYDVYQRLLAYVFVPSDTNPAGILANKYLIEQGMAREYTFKEPYTHQAAFKASEATARSEKKGLWSTCVPASAHAAS